MRVDVFVFLLACMRLVLCVDPGRVLNSHLQVMNDAFGFSLRDDYKEGPYYR
jgi:hypothetical protein